MYIKCCLADLLNTYQKTARCCCPNTLTDNDSLDMLQGWWYKADSFPNSHGTNVKLSTWGTWTDRRVLENLPQSPFGTWVTPDHAVHFCHRSMVGELVIAAGSESNWQGTLNWRRWLRTKRRHWLTTARNLLGSSSISTSAVICQTLEGFCLKGLYYNKWCKVSTKQC